MTQYRDFPQHEIEPQDFDKLLNGPLTYRVVYRRAYLCPCWDRARSSPVLGCPHCGGVGATWDDPGVRRFTHTLYAGSSDERLPYAGVTRLLGVEDEYGTRYGTLRLEAGALVWGDPRPERGTAYTVVFEAPPQSRLHAQGIRTQRSWEREGERVGGELRVSIPAHLSDLNTPNPAWLAAEGDRFVFPDLEKRHQQRLVKGENERLTYGVVHAVEGARAIEGTSVRHYRHGEDFLVTSGAVHWRGGPPDGTPYVLEYRCAHEYYVFQELPQQRAIAGERLPRAVSLRLFETYPYRA